MENNTTTPRIGFVRKMARDILKKAGITDAPVNLSEVVKYIRTKYPIDIIKANLPEDLDGITVVHKGTSNIGYNDNNHPHRKRFTVAHELGHVVLGHLCKDASLLAEQKKINETEADQFASELLIPREFLKKDVALGINGKSLAEKYWVSEQVIWIKLMEIKAV